MTISSTMILFASIMNFLLAFFVLFRKNKEREGKYFAFFAFVTSVWAFINFMLRADPSVDLLRLSYAFGVIVSSLAVIWVSFFLFNKLSKTIKYVVIPVSLIFFVLCYFTDWVVKSFYQSVNWGYSGAIGPFFLIYTMYVGLLIMKILYELYIGFRNSSGTKRLQIKYIYLGAIIFAITSFITSFITPLFFQIFNIVDNFSSLIFLLMIGAAIIRLQLFHIKILATEFLVFSIWLLLLGRIFFPIQENQWILDTALMVLVAVFGVLIIRSILKEVEIRNEMERIAQNLTIANERLRELDKAKSDFISITSHQLRAPLTSIKGYASMILEGSFGIIPKKARDAVDRIMESSQRLIITIEDFLDVGRIESGKMRYVLNQFDIEKMLRDIIEDFVDNVQKARDLNLEFIVRGDDFNITADQNKIRQVLSNLIDNSVKYTPHGFVKAFLSKSKEDGCVLIEIKDTGVGIAPEVINKLFHKFSRAEGVELLHTEGLGLGLYVAEKIIKAHKGEIWVESSGEGKGSSFFVKLPIDLS